VRVERGTAMKIDTGNLGEFILRDVHEPVVFETTGDEKLVVWVRDGMFDIAVRDFEAKGMTENDRRYKHYTVSSQGIQPTARIKEDLRRESFLNGCEVMLRTALRLFDNSRTYDKKLIDDLLRLARLSIGNSNEKL
jgi:hypothetical protein